MASGAREVDLAAEQGDAGAVLLGLVEQLEAVAGGAGAAAQHAHDHAGDRTRSAPPAPWAIVGI